MKLQKTLILIGLATLAVMLSNCDKEETTGDLEVFVKDISGTPLSSETVYLYVNQADFNNAVYSDSKVASSNGRVLFRSLEPGEYFVDCDFNNQVGSVTTISGSGWVSAGFVTTITITP